MSATAKMGFGMMVQTLKSSGLADKMAREVAFENLAKMIEDEELKIVNNSLLVTEKGQLWLKKQIADGRGTAN